MPAVCRLLLVLLHALEVPDHVLLAFACTCLNCGRSAMHRRGRERSSPERSADLPSWSSGNEPFWGGAPPRLRDVFDGRPKDIVAALQDLKCREMENFFAESKRRGALTSTDAFRVASGALYSEFESFCDPE